jgi:lipopolysaccharide/colanic/teichoic acid biosynthesis glycosyltransferase
MKIPANRNPLPSPSDDDIKMMPFSNRALDVVCCLLALPVLCILVLVMAVLTRLVSPGPVFFRQERVGFRGRPFKIFKFRTMTVGADARVHQNHLQQYITSNSPMVKLDALHDARLIPGGWMLRASGLDELPQLINVLRREMSLVGPRPCMPGEFEHFLPWQSERVNAVPGLTGLWQVSGKNRTTFDEMIRLDIHYARHASLWLNLKIILLTPGAVFVQINDTRLSRQSSALAVPVRPLEPVPPPEPLLFTNSKIAA